MTTLWNIVSKWSVHGTGVMLAEEAARRKVHASPPDEIAEVMRKIVLTPAGKLYLRENPIESARYSVAVFPPNQFKMREWVLRYQAWIFNAAREYRGTLPSIDIPDLPDINIPSLPDLIPDIDLPGNPFKKEPCVWYDIPCHLKGLSWKILGIAAVVILLLIALGYSGLGGAAGKAAEKRV